MSMRITGTKGAVCLVAVLSLVLFGTAVVAETAATDALLAQWAASFSFKTEVQAFDSDAGVLAELVVVPEVDALRTALLAVERIDGVSPEQLSAYQPSVAFKAIGTEYTYDVRLSPPTPGEAAPYYYVEVGASFADNMIRYHVLSGDGAETLAIKWYSGPDKEIRELPYDEYVKAHARGLLPVKRRQMPLCCAQSGRFPQGNKPSHFGG